MAWEKRRRDHYDKLIDRLADQLGEDEVIRRLKARVKPRRGRHPRAHRMGLWLDRKTAENERNGVRFPLKAAVEELITHHLSPKEKPTDDDYPAFKERMKGYRRRAKKKAQQGVQKSI
jgi:hypothetical protein